MIYKDIEELEELIDKLIGEDDYKNAIPVDGFTAIIADGSLEEYHEFTLWEIQDKTGSVVEYAIEQYHTGLQAGCFGVREVEAVYDLDSWHTTKKFYKKVSKEFSGG